MRRFLWLLMAAYAGLSQPTSQAAFEVASVKPSPPSSGDALNINLGAEGHGTVRMANVTLGECVLWAHDLVSAEQFWNGRLTMKASQA
jgi:uncharacterized protein (TIGR03435 family)